MDDNYQEIKTVTDVEKVLMRRASFNELLVCSVVAKEARSQELRERVASSLLNEAIGQTRPISRANREIKEAAFIVVQSLLGNAKNVQDVVKHATRARIALATRAEQSQNSQLQKVATKYGTELSNLCLLLSDSSISSLSRAAALLRSALIDRPDLAIEACDTAIDRKKAKSPKNTQMKATSNESVIFYTIKSSALCDLEEYEKAVETISTALTIKKLDKYVLNVYSRSLEGAGRLDEALVAVKKVLEKWPKDIWAVHRLLSVLKASGDLEELGETLKYLKKLVPSEPKRDQWIDLLGIEALMDSGELKTASEGFKAVGEPTSTANMRLYRKIKNRLSESPIHGQSM